MPALTEITRHTWPPLAQMVIQWLLQKSHSKVRDKHNDICDFKWEEKCNQIPTETS